MHVLVPCLSKNLQPRPSKKMEIASAVKSREGNLLADEGRRAAVWFMLPDSGLYGLGFTYLCLVGNGGMGYN